MNFILKGVAFIVALQLLPVSITGAIAGDWAVASDGCKVWNPHPTRVETIRWTGACKDGFVEGMGALEWQRGAKTYERDEGQWRAGRQVSGSQVSPGGQYDGQFADSLPNGPRHPYLWRCSIRRPIRERQAEWKRDTDHWHASGSFDGNWADGCFNDGKHRAAIGVSVQSCP